MLISGSQEHTAITGYLIICPVNLAFSIIWFHHNLHKSCMELYAGEVTLQLLDLKIKNKIK